MAKDRRAELRTWIDETQSLQRKLAVSCTVAVAIAVGLRCWSSSIGDVALLIVALVTACSFWVTAAHNAAHRQKLAELDRRAAQ
jgi:hypothetical protein